MSHCDSHESEGGHPDEVCACCGTCIQCTGGKWSDHVDASCAQGIDTRPEAVRIASWVESEGLCPDVICGCEHTMVMDESGAAVACRQ